MLKLTWSVLGQFLFLVFWVAVSNAQTICTTPDFLGRAPTGDIHLAPVSHHRVIGYEGFVKNSNGPVLILLPGVYRGALSSDSFTSELTARGISWVTIHLSAQPMAVDHGQTLQATFDDVTSPVFKQEIVNLVNSLCIRQPVYVPLSYSASIGAELTEKETSMIIDTTPMGTFVDGLPDEGLNWNLAQEWSALNPFWGMGWNAMKEASYRKFWASAVDQYIQRYPNIASSPTLREIAISGYTSMSKAIENFDFRNVGFRRVAHRAFIIAEKEDFDRRRVQIEAIDKATHDLGVQPLVFVIQNTGHNVLNDAPVAWAEALRISLSAELHPTQVGLVSQAGTVQWLTAPQWQIMKRHLLQDN